MTQEKLNRYSKVELAQLAKKKGIPRWHAMRKDQLVRALLRVYASLNGRRSDSRAAKRKKARRSKSRIQARHRTTSRRNRRTRSAGSPSKDLARGTAPGLPESYRRDRIVLMVRDPYWIHAYWEITRGAVERAEAALREHWYGAKPILRLFDVTSKDTTSNAERRVRDIDIHGTVNNWYINVSRPGRSYRVGIGYLTRHGRFYALAHSNVVTTPRASASDVIDENWVSVQGEFEKIYAMSGGQDPAGSSLELKELFEERLRRPIGSSPISHFGSGAMQKQRRRQFWFKLDAELVVYGATAPGARVTLQGEPVQLRPDGTFTMRFGLPDRRQIIPAVAASPDGNEERTIVLAVERNTKELEPMVHDRGV